MIGGIRLKVCGLATQADAEFAGQAGADYLGFNLHPASPRYLPLGKFRAFVAHLPAGKNVAIAVEPTPEQLAEMIAAKFDYFQLHFRHDLPAATVATWSRMVGVARLWLAPKLPPGVDLPAALLPLAGTFLLDTFDEGKFGGTGRTGDWAKFARHQQAHPEKTWILSGGLNPENISEALKQSGARFVDVNSGVESAPGVKDQAKLQNFAGRLRERRT